MNHTPAYGATQVLGKPNMLVGGVETPCAWTPNGANFGEDWISVGFAEPMKIKQVAVCETINPGAITHIFALNEAGEAILLHTNKEALVKEAGRVWHVTFPETAFEVHGIKLVIDHARKKGMKQIDAVAISDSEEPVKVVVNTVDWGLGETVLESLGSEVNSNVGEQLAPIITADGKELYFTRINHPQNIKSKNDKYTKQDIWYSVKKGKTWATPQNIGSPLNNEQDNAATCISADGNTLYVLNEYRKDGRMNVGLSKSRRTINGWSFPEKIVIEDFQALKQEENVNGQAMQMAFVEFSISPDEKIIVMGLKRSQTYGNRDIYVSFKKLDGTYSRPRSLGPVINTADAEGSPFLAPDTKTLYFMSKGHLGFGNGDIFVSKRLDETWVHWSEPLNMGPPINTPEWNGYINVPAAGDYALISTKIDKNGANGIFRAKVPPQLRPEPLAVVTGKILDLVTKKNIPGKIQLRSVGDTTNLLAIDLNYIPDEGEFKFVLPVGRDYLITVEQTGYLGIVDSLILRNEKNYREIKFDLLMTEIKAGQKMILNQLFFERARYEIQSASYEELARIIKLMQAYPTMEVMLEGHTDNQGDLMKNVELAKNRVEAVKSYLVENGRIEPDRISTKSWGPTRPISSNASEETRKKNRRVEFTIVKL